MMRIKKIFSLMFAFIFLVSVLTVSANADDGKNIISEKEIEINEWDAYNRIVSMTDKELLNEGLSEQEISEIREFNYEDEIRKRAALDDETLRLYGYSKDEIIELRQAAKLKSIPENTIKSISTATMWSSLRYVDDDIEVQGGINMYCVKLRFAWRWTRLPFFKLIDSVAVAFASTTSDAFTYLATEDDKVTVTLAPVSDSYSTSYTFTTQWQFSTSKPNSIYANFGVAYYDGDDNLTHFAYSGHGTFWLSNRSSNARLYVDACYGHMTVNVIPGYSVNSSGFEVEIDFTFGFDDQHCTGCFFENYTISRNYIYYGNVYGKDNTGGTPL